MLPTLYFTDKQSKRLKKRLKVTQVIIRGARIQTQIILCFNVGSYLLNTHTHTPLQNLLGGNDIVC